MSDFNISTSYQFEKGKETGKIPSPSSMETYYWEKYFESLEQKDSTLDIKDTGFTKVLKYQNKNL